MTKQQALLTATIWTSLFVPAAVQGQYVMENLGRGVIAICTTDSSVYVGWRLLGTDPPDIAFNVYRAAGAGAAARLNSAPSWEPRTSWTFRQT